MNGDPRPGDELVALPRVQFEALVATADELKERVGSLELQLQTLLQLVHEDPLGGFMRFIQRIERREAEQEG